MQNPQNYVIVLRFFGTTRESSSIKNCLLTIINQLDNYFGFESGTSELLKMSDIKVYFIAQLNKIKQTHSEKKLIFFLDSIDQLHSNDYNLNWMLTEFPDNVKMVYSTLAKHGNILERIMTFGIDKDQNFLKIEKLDLNLALSILNEWLKRANRSLTPDQKNMIEDLFANATLYPLYVKLIFDIVSKWKSYYQPDESFKSCSNIDECIKYLFKDFEVILP